MRKRTSADCSLASGGKLAKSNTETRAQLSGRISAAPLRLRVPLRGTMARAARANSSGCRILSRRGETEITPGANARKSSVGGWPVVATAMPASDSLKASAGGGACNKEVMERKKFMPGSAFDEGNFVDFF